MPVCDLWQYQLEIEGGREEWEQAVIPDLPGRWISDEDEEIEVYPLEPCGDVLCVWGPDVGLSYTGAAETQGVWTTDEWQGHIPVMWYCEGQNWRWAGPIF